jgi:hypothetical protein
MTVLNDMGRRVPKCARLHRTSRRALRNKLIEHKLYVSDLSVSVSLSESESESIGD